MQVMDLRLFDAKGKSDLKIFSQQVVFFFFVCGDFHPMGSQSVKNHQEKQKNPRDLDDLSRSNPAHQGDGDFLSFGMTSWLILLPVH